MSNPVTQFAQKVLNFELEPQIQPNWCWAAVVNALLKYYYPEKVLSQDEIVKMLLSLNGKLYNRYFNSAAVIDKPLNIFNLLNTKIIGQISFDNLQCEIDAGRVVGARIGWKAGGGHFVVIHGYRIEDDKVFLNIADPLHGSCEIPLSEFKENYLTKGRWTHTYYTRKC